MPIALITPTDATFIAQNQPNTNFGPQENIYVGRGATPIDVFRSLLHFDLSAIPPGAIITNATLRLFFFLKVVSGVQPLSAQELLSSFSQNTVTWNIQPASGGTIFSTNLTEGNVNNFIFLELTDLVQDWFDGDFPNNGLLLTTIETQVSIMGFRGFEAGNVPN